MHRHLHREKHELNTTVLLKILKEMSRDDFKTVGPFRASNSNKKFTIAHDSFVKDVSTTENSILELTDHQFVNFLSGPLITDLISGPY